MGLTTEKDLENEHKRGLLSDHCLVSVCFPASPPRVHLLLVGKLRFMSDINQPSLLTPFYSVLVSVSVFMAFSTVFHSINFLENATLFHSVLPVLFLLYWSFQLYISF